MGTLGKLLPCPALPCRNGCGWPPSRIVALTSVILIVAGYTEAFSQNCTSQTCLQSANNLSELESTATTAVDNLQITTSNTDTLILEGPQPIAMTSGGSASASNSVLFSWPAAQSGLCGSVPPPLKASSCAGYYFPSNSYAHDLLSGDLVPDSSVKAFDVDATLSAGWSGGQRALNASIVATTPPAGVFATTLISAAQSSNTITVGLTVATSAASTVTTLGTQAPYSTGTLTVGGSVGGSFAPGQAIVGANIPGGTTIQAPNGSPASATFAISFSPALQAPLTIVTPEEIDAIPAVLPIVPGQAVSSSPASSQSSPPFQPGTYVQTVTATSGPPYQATITLSAAPTSTPPTPSNIVFTGLPLNNNIVLQYGQYVANGVPSRNAALKTSVTNPYSVVLINGTPVNSAFKQTVYGPAVPTGTVVTGLLADSSGVQWIMLSALSSQMPTSGSIPYGITFGTPQTFQTGSKIQTYCSAPLGGTGGLMQDGTPYLANYTGSCVGQLLKALAPAGSGALQSLVGEEIDLELGDTLGTLSHYGVHIVESSGDVAQGIEEDAALSIGGAISPAGPASNVVPGFRSGLAFGGEWSDWPIGTAGTIIAAVPYQAGEGGTNSFGMQAATGLDIAMVNFANAALRTPGFNGFTAGTMWSGGLSFTPIVTFNAGGAVASFTETLSANLWTVTSCTLNSGGFGYQTGDVVYTPDGSACTLTVSGSGIGQAISARLVSGIAGHSSMQGPTTHIKTIGGRGQLATVNLTWRQPLTLALQSAPTNGGTGPLILTTGQNQLELGSPLSWKPPVQGATQVSVAVKPPSGSSAVQEWLEVLDGAGNPHYVPAF